MKLQVFAILLGFTRILGSNSLQGGLILTVEALFLGTGWHIGVTRQASVAGEGTDLLKARPPQQLTGCPHMGQLCPGAPF